MVVEPDNGALTVPADAELAIKVIGSDTHKLDNSKLKYGICNGAGGAPAPVGPVNSEVIELGKLKIPENAHIYLDATDVSGNRQVLFVPLKIK
jgi:hypothetical protein